MNQTIDGAPLFTELFKLLAYLKTFAQLSLGEERKKEFNELCSKNLENVIKEFIKDHPGVINNSEELLKNLDEADQ